jgi:hypothetical protein
MPTNFDPNPLLAIVGAVVLVVGPYTKSVIDGIHLGVDLPQWAPFLISAIVGAVLSGVLVMAAGSQVISTPWQLVAIVVFSALGCALVANGQTGLHNRAQEARYARRK